MMKTTSERAIKTPYFERTTLGFSPESSTIEANYVKAIKHFTHTVTTETLEQKFARLTLNWKDDFNFSSSSYPLLMNPSYLGVIAMGKKALPLIFKDLQKSPSHWFMALAILTDANPVTPDIRGNVKAMTLAWITWGKEQGYVA